jgi:hypothetical protein
MAVVLDYKEKQSINCKLQTFLKEIYCSDTELKLLRFWARRPQAKLAIYTVTEVTDTSENNFRNAIAALVEKGILTAEHDRNGLTSYTLSDLLSPEYIDELASLDLGQMLQLGRKIQREIVSTPTT